MSERAKHYEPLSPDQERINRVEELINNDEKLDEASKKLESDFPEEKRKVVEDLDREEIVDLHEKINQEIKDKSEPVVDALGVDDEAKQRILDEIKASFAREAAKGLYPLSENDKDPYAELRQNTTELLMLSDDDFKDTAEKWTAYEDIQVASEMRDKQEDEAHSYNKFYEQTEKSIENGDTYTALDGTKFEFTSSFVDEEGNRVYNVRTTSPDGKTDILSGTLGEIDEATLEHNKQAAESKNKDQENKKDLDAQEMLDRLETAFDTKEKSEAEKEQEALKQRFEDLTQDLRDLLDTFKPDAANLEQNEKIDDTFEELRALRDQIEKNRIATEAAPKTGGETTTGEAGLETTTVSESNEKEAEKRWWEKFIDAIKNPREFLNNLKTSTLTGPRPSEEDLKDPSQVSKWTRRVVVGAGLLFVAYAATKGWMSGDELQATNMDTQPIFGANGGGGDTVQNTADNVLQFSEAAHLAEDGEGWLKTIKETTGITNNNQLTTILDEVGPGLVQMGEAYKDAEIGGYGISHKGQLSTEALKLIHDTAVNHGFIK